MNTTGSIKITFAAPVLAPPLPKTEATTLPAPPCVRRALPFNLDVVSSGNLNSSGLVPHGRWDSARAVARELLIGLIPSRPVTNPIGVQLQFHFA